MNKYVEFFLNSNSSVVQLELLEISHPNFSKVYRIVRNSISGVEVTLENGEIANFEYYPLRIAAKTSKADLDQAITITLGDLGEILPNEIERISSEDGFSIKPTVIYRTYRSDSLSSPMYGPVVFEVASFSFNREGSTFDAKAPSLNVNKTGEIYKLDRFPMLRGFL